MRLTRLELIAYGPFTDHSLDLGAPGVHLVVGPNEAGKSSALNAICDALYGMPTRTTAAFVHQMPDLRVGLTLAKADGSTRQFVRLKKRRDSLRTPDETIVPESELLALLGDIDRETFTTSFGLTHERLVQGSKDLAEGRGELGRALFGASSGSTNLAAVAQELEKRGGELLKPSGRSGRIHELTKELEQLRTQLRSAQLRPGEFVELTAEVRDLGKQIDGYEARVENLSREHQLSQILLGKLAQLRQWREVSDEVAGLEPTALPLRAELAEELDEARSELTEATELHARESAQLKRLEGQADEVDVDSAVLEFHAEIDRLRDRRSEYESKSAARSPIGDRLRNNREKLTQLLQRLRPETPLDEAASAVSVGLLAESTVTALVAEYPAIEITRTAADHALVERTGELDELEGDLAKLPASPNTDQLGAALSTAQSAGDLEAERRTAVAKVAELDTEMRTQLTHLGLTDRDANEAAKLSVPAVAQIEAARDAADSLRNRHDSAAANAAEKTDELRDLNSQLEQLLADTHVPSLAQLEEERRDRSNIWQRIKTLWLGEKPEPDPAQEPSEWDEETNQHDVASAYESAVVAADSTADRLRTDADTVAQRAEFERQIAGLHAKLQIQSHELAETARAQEVAQAQWLALWEPVAIHPGPPAEMREWADDFAEFQRTQSAAKSVASAADALTERIDELSNQLRTALRDVDVEVPGDILLPTLITRVQETLDALTTRADQREQVLRDIERVRKAHKKAEGEQNRATEEVQEWTNRWIEAMSSLQLPTHTSTDVATTFLEQTAAARALLEHVGNDQSELDRIDEFVTSFDHDADAVLTAIAPKRTGDDYAAAVRHLADLLAVAREAQAGLEQLRTLQEEHLQKMETFSGDIASARSRINLLVEEADVTDEAALVAAVERTEQLRQARSTQAALETEISAAANGRTAADLYAALGDDDESSLQSRIDRLGSEVERVRESLAGDSKAIFAKRQLLGDMDGSAVAAEIGEQIEFVSAEIAQLAEEYQGIRLASMLLQDQISAFREEHQGPILGKAGPWFRRLTLGSFVALETDADESGVIVLQGVRQSGERVGVEGMSDGTRDQLYLALRLAAIAVASEAMEPMPLILDDVLIQFDDERSAAALEILGELSASTQIILFTHHQHVAGIARTTLGSGLAEHRLEARDFSKAGAAARPAALVAAASVSGWGAASSTATGSSGEAELSDNDAQDLVRSTLASAAEPLSRSEILSRSGITKARWTKTIGPLVDAGKVTRTGLKKGARYALPSD